MMNIFFLHFRRASSSSPRPLFRCHAPCPPRLRRRHLADARLHGHGQRHRRGRYLNFAKKWQGIQKAFAFSFLDPRNEKRGWNEFGGGGYGKRSYEVTEIENCLEVCDIFSQLIFDICDS